MWIKLLSDANVLSDANETILRELYSEVFSSIVVDKSKFSYDATTSGNEYSIGSLVLNDVVKISISYFGEDPSYYKSNDCYDYSISMPVITDNSSIYKQPKYIDFDEITFWEAVESIVEYVNEVAAIMEN